MSAQDSSGLGLGGRLRAHRDPQPAALRHRVPGVDREVDERVLEPAGVHRDREPLLAEVGLERHVLADEPPEHRLDLGHDGPHVHELRLEQ